MNNRNLDLDIDTLARTINPKTKLPYTRGPYSPRPKTDEGKRLYAVQKAREYRARNPHKGAEMARTYREKNGDLVRKKNREAQREKAKNDPDFHKKAHAKRGEKERTYRKNNREKERARQKERLKNNPSFRIKRCISVSLWKAVTRYGNGKHESALCLLGCSIEFLRHHLEKQFMAGMDWENYGARWHIDHILPCASFDLTNEDHRRKCFHYTNLQPLWAEHNFSKNARLDWNIKKYEDFYGHVTK